MRYLEEAAASRWVGGGSDVTVSRRGFWGNQAKAWVGERDTIGVGGVNLKGKKLRVRA